MRYSGRIAFACFAVAALLLAATGGHCDTLDALVVGSAAAVR